MVDPRTRAKLLSESAGTGDVFLDRWGVNALRPQDQKVVKARGRTQARVEVEKPQEDPDALPPWWWNPGNPLAQSLPASVSIHRFQLVRTALRSIDPRLDITYNPDRQSWQVWYKKAGFLQQAPWTNGWVHLKDFKPYQGTSYILQTIRAMDRVRKSLKDHYREVKQRREDVHRANRAARMEQIEHIAGEVYDHHRIQVSGYGKSSGSKFSQHHA